MKFKNKFVERTVNFALSYAMDRGWRVLPVSKRKIPLIQNWSQTASCDPSQIKEWWYEYPHANIGILTGPESGIWVVDIDIKDETNGLNSLAMYFKDDFIFDTKKYLVGKTPTGGIHLVFQWPSDKDYTIKTTSKVLKGVDLRGNGGQIIVAPSSRNIKDEWIEYRWNDHSLPVSPMTPWAYEIAQMAGEKTGKKLDLTSIIGGLDKGERDEQLFKFAWLLRMREVPYDMALAFVQEASVRCNPPFDLTIAEDKVNTAYTTMIDIDIDEENLTDDHKEVLKIARQWEKDERK